MRIFLLVMAAVTAAPALAQEPGPGRGQLLYGNHCIECHTTQMHWRDQRLARDWVSLVGQVRRFQGVAGLNWNDEDVAAVAHYLNDSIYRFPLKQAGR